jgi:hypothetical protein
MGTGAPAHRSTRTSTRAAASASRFRSTTGSRSFSSTKSGDMNHPVMWTCERAPRISSIMAGRASAPSISTSTPFPGRGGGASSAQPPEGASSAALPSRARRRRCLAFTAAVMPSPALRSSR